MFGIFSKFWENICFWEKILWKNILFGENNLWKLSWLGKQIFGKKSSWGNGPPTNFQNRAKIPK